MLSRGKKSKIHGNKVKKEQQAILEGECLLFFYFFKNTGLTLLSDAPS